MMTDAERVVQMKAEILHDIAEGKVPETVRMFAELHDYVDANEYGGLTLDAPVDTPEWDELVDQANRCQSAVDEWLHVGRRDVPWLTLGELRRRTAHLDDHTPITAATPDGGWWLNLGMDDSGIPTGVAGDDPPSIILDTRDDFDTRQW